MNQNFPSQDESPYLFPKIAPQKTGACFKQQLLVLVALFAFLLSSHLLGFSFARSACQVNQRSMWPTLESGQIVMLKESAVIQFRDIVVFKVENYEVRPEDKDSSYIKRVIGLPGDELTFHLESDNAVTLLRNGTPLLEPYIAERMKLDADHFGTPIYNSLKMTGTHFERLSPGTVWVMGDNRNHSLDSRVLGPINMADITGVVSDHSPLANHYQNIRWAQILSSIFGLILSSMFFEGYFEMLLLRNHKKSNRANATGV